MWDDLSLRAQGRRGPREALTSSVRGRIDRQRFGKKARRLVTVTGRQLEQPEIGISGAIARIQIERGPECGACLLGLPETGLNSAQESMRCGPLRLDLDRLLRQSRGRREIAVQKLRSGLVVARGPSFRKEPPQLLDHHIELGGVALVRV